MISIDDGVGRIVARFAPLPAEQVAITEACGRVTAEDIRARMNQPPAPVSAMDGYALRQADAIAGAELRIAGVAPAGHPYAGIVGAGEAVRIFTGGVVPDGADTIVIQENAEQRGDRVRFNQTGIAGRHIRPAGLDFKQGDVLVASGQRLSARDLPLIAAGDIAGIAVRRRPRIAFTATGDELTLPGAAKRPGAIVASSGYGLSAYIASWGGEPIDLGIVPDSVEAIAALPQRAAGADLLVTLGGASVGEHDLIQKALGPKGLAVEFWKIAMRPGKPLLFGHIGDLPVLGLPGNPVSTLVCALLFLRPAIAAMLGTDTAMPRIAARLTAPLGANDARQDYIRSRLEWRNGEAFATPFPLQDSSMLSAFARADGLIIRAPHAAIAAAGAKVEVMPLDRA